MSAILSPKKQLYHGLKYYSPGIKPEENSEVDSNRNSYARDEVQLRE